MQGKTVLVTGATSGIGLVTALELARKGARVLVHGRSAERGVETVAQIWSQVPGADVTYVEADLASLADVRALARRVRMLAPKLDVLVNNAGAINGKRKLSADGFELTFAVNHLAHFLLTNLLLENLKAAPQGRIVNVASRAHFGPQIDFDDINLTGHYKTFRAYQMSKLANVLFTAQLAKRLAGTPVTVNSLHPGVVRTGFAQRGAGLFGAGFKLLTPFFISPEQGAQTSIYLASAPEISSVSGQYLAKCAPAPSSPEAHDAAAAERLWALSERMTGLTA